MRQQNQTPPANKTGVIVEDTQTAGGTDKVTGASVVRPVTTPGRLDEGTIATDPRQNAVPKG